MVVRTALLSLIALAFFAATQTAEAQRPGRFPQASLESTATGLVSQESVRTEIKLDEEQSKKIREIFEASRSSAPMFPNRESLEGLSEEDRRAKMTDAFEKFTAFREEQNKKLKEVLTPEQIQRLKEIAFQTRLQFGAEGALGIDEFVEAAKVTDEQKEKVQELRRQMREEAEKQGDDRRAQFEWMRNEGAKKYAPKFEELLTAEQKEVFTKMKGAEFDLSKLDNRRGQRPNN